MELITKTETQTVHKTEKVNVQVYKTSDGREFSIHEKQRAEVYQQGLDKIAAFKTRINYKELNDAFLCYHSEKEHSKSFTFDWDAETMADIADEFFRITDIKPKGFLPTGKYLVVEYYTFRNNSNGADYEDYDGFFGTVEEYLQMLDRAKSNALAELNK